MASEDAYDMSVTSEGSNDVMGKKLLGLWSRLNEHLSPEAKSHLKDIMEQYKGLDESEKKDFEDNFKYQLTNYFSGAVRNRYLPELMSSTLVGVCAATIFLVFVFFGYKLYKSLKEKERKRDEKKKLRQQKKKK